jgi:hypothetical protein
LLFGATAQKSGEFIYKQNWQTQSPAEHPIVIFPPETFSSSKLAKDYLILLDCVLL